MSYLQYVCFNLVCVLVICNMSVFNLVWIRVIWNKPVFNLVWTYGYQVYPIRGTGEWAIYKASTIL